MSRHRATPWTPLPRCVKASQVSYSKTAAKAQLRRAQSDPTNHQRAIYRCDHCGHFHLTAKP